MAGGAAWLHMCMRKPFVSGSNGHDGMVQAPSEAEAQCCSMCKEGLVYGVATDDMDALTFGTPKLIRHLMAPGSNQKLTIDEFDYETMLKQMEITPVCPRSCCSCLCPDAGDN